MSRHVLRETQVAKVMADYAHDNPFLGQVLVMDDPTGMVANAIGQGASVWNRRAGGKTQGSPWPPEGSFQAVVLRLPKAKDELTMDLAAAHGALRPDGELFLYGPNDGGIKSAPQRFEPLFDRALTEAARGHCRVVRARPVAIDNRKKTLAAWKESFHLESPQGPLSLVSYPGMFAHGRLDPGSETLLNHLPKTSGPISVLDFGCGAGVLTLGLQVQNPEIRATLFDNDAVALVAAGENIPGAECVLGSRMSDSADSRFDLILSNPPFHSGQVQDFAMLEDLCSHAPDHLTRGGTLTLVVQRTAPVARLLGDAFGQVDLVAENKSFRVWQAS